MVLPDFARHALSGFPDENDGGDAIPALKFTSCIEKDAIGIALAVVGLAGERHAQWKASSSARISCRRSTWRGAMNKRREGNCWRNRRKILARISSSPPCVLPPKRTRRSCFGGCATETRLQPVLCLNVRIEFDATCDLDSVSQPPSAARLSISSSLPVRRRNREGGKSARQKIGIRETVSRIAEIDAHLLTRAGSVGVSLRRRGSARLRLQPE